LAYPGISLGKVKAAQPTDISDVLKRALPEESLTDWQITNCAEFNAVNNALLNGAKLENLTVATVWTDTGAVAPPCANCSTWISKLGINVAK
jgi:cytidine deaminase